VALERDMVANRETVQRFKPRGKDLSLRGGGNSSGNLAATDGASLVSTSMFSEESTRVQRPPPASRCAYPQPVGSTPWVRWWGGGGASAQMRCDSLSRPSTCMLTLSLDPAHAC
jgi:hypothetical protein